jgi:dipeptidyl aminopeptidase/acylaminoacyl peptidase
MTTLRVRRLVRALVTLKPWVSGQIRAVAGSTLLMAAYLTISSGRQVNSPTDWEAKQLAYDSPRQQIREGSFWESIGSDVHVRSGPRLKGERVLDTAKRPKWSRDGGSLAFLTNCRAGPGIERLQCVETARADGSHRIRLTSDHVKDWVSAFNFAWSPSGDEIAYIQGDDHRTTLGIVRPDGSRRKEIQHLQCPALMATSDWSPDGQQIAFTGCPSSGRTVMVIDRTGEGAHSVADGYGAQWSPNGKTLLFRKKGLCVVKADGTEERTILDGELAMFGLTWLPSGHSIGFASSRDKNGGSEIFRVNLDGTGLQKVASGAREGLLFASPIFSPDEQKLIVVSEPSLEYLQEDILPDLDVPWLRKTDALPTVLLIDLATGHKQKLAEGGHPDVVWGHK